MSDRKLSVFYAVLLGQMLDMLGHRVRWLTDDGNVLSGVVRHVVRDVKYATFPLDTDDIRDCYLRISGTFEYFLPVPEVVAKIGKLEFTLDD